MKSATLGEISDRSNGVIQTGPFGSQLHQSDYRSEGVPVVMPQDIVGNHISDEKIAYIDETLATQLGRHLLAQEDIVFPRRGEINKRAIICAEQVGYFCGTGCLKISIPPVEIYPKWLFYYLGLEHIVKWIEGNAVGAIMLNLNTNILRALPIDYPPLDEQGRIVECLSAYDDLIATNQRRIALLEDAARRLYREWFVHLRFPGHESVPMKDGVPEGWEQKPLGVIAPLNYGKALKSTDRKDGKVPVYGSSGIVGVHNVALVDGGAIVVGRKGNVGSLFFSPVPCFPIDTVYYIVPAQASYRLFLALHQLNFISSDAAVPGLNRTYAHSLPVLQPSDDVAVAFEGLVQPMFEQSQHLTEQNTQLARARDLLLPKLMSGELDVSGISMPEEVTA